LLWFERWLSLVFFYKKENCRKMRMILALFGEENDNFLVREKIRWRQAETISPANLWLICEDTQFENQHGFWPHKFFREIKFLAFFWELFAHRMFTVISWGLQEIQL
jgi:hypothetical protein